MNYKDYKPNIKSGDLLAFSTTNSDSILLKIAFRLIQMFTRSRFHHVGVALVLADRTFIVEAVPPRVRIYPLSHKSSFLHFDMGLSENWKPPQTSLLLRSVGKDYSIIQAIMSVLKVNIKDSKWYCSELVIDFYKNFNIDLGPRLTPGDVVAKAIRNFKSTWVNIK